MVSPERALPGREQEMKVSGIHTVLGTPIRPPFPEGTSRPRVLGTRLLLGRRARLLEAPRRLHDGRRLHGRLHAEPNLRGGLQRAHRAHGGGARRVRPRARSPTRRSCASSGRTTTPLRACARATTSAPSTARRSTTTPTSNARLAEASEIAYEEQLEGAGYGPITTEIAQAGPFYYAEDYHQQYLDKNPNGYCGLGGTGVSCPIGLALPAQVDAAAPAAG